MVNEVMPAAAALRSRTPIRREWRIASLLVLLSVVPVGAGIFRLTELSLGGPLTADNARFFEAPTPVVAHVVCATLFALLGAFQVMPGFRTRQPAVHRIVGRILLPSGFIVAFSGLWMTVVYDLPETDGELLLALRLLFGSAMAISLTLAAVALLRRDFPRHGAWMIRAYAIALGAGTQFLTHLPWALLVGTPGELPRAVLMGAGWTINLAVAERVLRRRAAR